MGHHSASIEVLRTTLRRLEEGSGLNHAAAAVQHLSRQLAILLTELEMGNSDNELAPLVQRLDAAAHIK